MKICYKIVIQSKCMRGFFRNFKTRKRQTNMEASRTKTNVHSLSCFNHRLLRPFVIANVYIWFVREAHSAHSFFLPFIQSFWFFQRFQQSVFRRKSLFAMVSGKHTHGDRSKKNLKTKKRHSGESFPCLEDDQEVTHTRVSTPDRTGKFDERSLSVTLKSPNKNLPKKVCYANVCCVCKDFTLFCPGKRVHGGCWTRVLVVMMCYRCSNDIIPPHRIWFRVSQTSLAARPCKPFSWW